MAMETMGPERAPGQAAPWHPGMGEGDGRWIEYPDSGQRDAELDERRAAYEREAERRALLERERRRHEEIEREEAQERERIEREQAEREPRRWVEHSVRREPTSTLLRDFVTEAQNLITQEIRLAKAEIRHEARLAGKGATGVVIGAGLALLGALALTACLIAALGTLMPVWVAALVVGGLFLLVGAMIAMGGISKLKTVDPRPRETTATLKEDREWASGTMRDVRSRRRAHA